MQFENNRCYSAVLHFAVTGTRLLYQQSSEFLARVVSSQTALPSTNSCSQTATATCCPCCQADDTAKRIYCKSRVSTHNFKTKQEHRFHHGLQYHMTTEPRQASKLHITSHPGKTSRSYTNQTGLGSCSQKHPCLSTAPSSSPFPLSQTRSRV